jgi:putative oxidoreductase
MNLPFLPELQSLVLLLFRLNWGIQFFLTGKGKLANHEKVTEFFTSLGIPMPGLNAWFVGGVEMIGGLLLLLGIGTRPTALILVGNMLVAYLSVPEDRAALLGAFQNPDAFTAASPFFFLLTAVLCLAFGPGRWSMESLLEWRKRKWSTVTNSASPAN